MTAPKIVRPLRLGVARKLTRGFAEEGVLEPGNTRIKPMD